MTGIKYIDEEGTPYRHLDFATIVSQIAIMKKDVTRIGRLVGLEIDKGEAEIGLTRQDVVTDEKEPLRRKYCRMSIHTSRRSPNTSRITVSFGMVSSGSISKTISRILHMLTNRLLIYSRQTEMI